MMYPGFGVAGELRDRGGELSIDDIGEGYGLEDGAQVGADRDPDLLQVLGRALVLDRLGPLAPDVGEGPSTARMMAASEISSAGNASQ